MSSRYWTKKILKNFQGCVNRWYKNKKEYKFLSNQYLLRLELWMLEQTQCERRQNRVQNILICFGYKTY